MSTDPRPLPTEPLSETADLSEVQDLHAPVLRERREPQLGSEPIPLWLVISFVLLLIASGAYLQQFSGGFRFDALEGTYRPLPTASARRPLDPISEGRMLFTAQGCIACHQPTGQGLPGQFPPLAGSDWVQGKPDRLCRVLLHGMMGPVVVRGQTFNNVMPPFGAALKDEQIAALLTFVRQEWGNSSGPVSPATVATVRAAHAGRTTPWTAGELLELDTENQTAAPNPSQ